MATYPRSIGQHVQCLGVVYINPLAGTQPFSREQLALVMRLAIVLPVFMSVMSITPANT